VDKAERWLEKRLMEIKRIKDRLKSVSPKKEEWRMEIDENDYSSCFFD